eukprot:COSAG06_NODE_5912_length_3215_cov_3.685815_2_plen_144_part_00
MVVVNRDGGNISNATSLTVRGYELVVLGCEYSQRIGCDCTSCLDRERQERIGQLTLGSELGQAHVGREQVPRAIDVNVRSLDERQQRVVFCCRVTETWFVQVLALRADVEARRSETGVFTSAGHHVGTGSRRTIVIARQQKLG